MKPRRAAKVTVTDKRDLNTKKTMITVHPEGGFALSVDGVVVARCEYAKRLADWAFEKSAFEVRHSYDLALSDREP
jgi:hypothetical protein